MDTLRIEITTFKILGRNFIVITVKKQVFSFVCLFYGEKLATVFFKICFQWLFLESALGKIVFLIYWPVYNMEYINISNHNKYAIKTSSMLILIG